MTPREQCIDSLVAASWYAEGVWIHWQLDRLFNSLFKLATKKTLNYWPFVRGIHREHPSERPLMTTAFPYHGVIMLWAHEDVFRKVSNASKWYRKFSTTTHVQCSQRAPCHWAPVSVQASPSAWPASERRRWFHYVTSGRYRWSEGRKYIPSLTSWSRYAIHLTTFHSNLNVYCYG